MNNAPKTEVPFLFYVKQGKCKSNSEMPNSGEAFRGWLSAASVIRNQERHNKNDVQASLVALRNFVKQLTDNQEIKEKDLLSYL
jgi:hypothetical protein